MLIFNLFISLTSFFVNSQPLLYSINTLPRLFYYPCTSFTLLIHSLNILLCASFALSTHSLVILFTCLSFALSTSSLFILCILIVFTLSIHPSSFYSSLSYFALNINIDININSISRLFIHSCFSTNSLPRYSIRLYLFFLYKLTSSLFFSPLSLLFYQIAPS